jgi:glycosyltransferase involved in cell wall biosynthesis
MGRKDLHAPSQALENPASALLKANGSSPVPRRLGQGHAVGERLGAGQAAERQRQLRARDFPTEFGGDGVSYGTPPPTRSTFKKMMLQELGAKIDLTRVHFVGMLEYHDYLNLLQVSSVHVYLTYPLVLSWSFIEAMACGCLVVGSRTAPVLEVLRDGVNGLTVDFFAPKALATRIETALEHPEDMQTLRSAARRTAMKYNDLKKVLLPHWTALFDDLINGR